MLYLMYTYDTSTYKGLVLVDIGYQNDVLLVYRNGVFSVPVMSVMFMVLVGI